MKRSDWVLIWCWAAFVAVIGPGLFSARDWLLFSLGCVLLGVLVFCTQRRVRSLIKDKYNA